MELMAQLVELTSEFRALGITGAKAMYSGSGDEGFCEEAEYFSDIEQTEPFEGEVPYELDLALRDLAFDFSGELAGGWWNNEGGYGHVSFDLIKPSADVQHEDAYTEYNHSEGFYE